MRDMVKQLTAGGVTATGLFAPHSWPAELSNVLH